MNMRRILMFALLAATVALAGCPKSDTVKEPPPEQPSADASQEGLEAEGVEEGTQADAEAAARQAALRERVVYFEFDSYDIQPQYAQLISAHARNLSTTGAVKVRLEGHTDERGSREYNIGLGERRAQAVRRALMLQGAGEGQIVTVSYGEERPAQAGSDEAAWSRNRRVELVYGG
jgi:peptidoglycan-associated lipoprotein